MLACDRKPIPVHASYWLCVGAGHACEVFYSQESLQDTTPQPAAKRALARSRGHGPSYKGCLKTLHCLCEERSDVAVHHLTPRSSPQIAI